MLSAKCPRPPGKWERKTSYERRFEEPFERPIIPCTRFSHSMDPIIHTCVKPTLLRRRTSVYESFSNRRNRQKSLKLTVPWNLAKLLKHYHGIIVHQRLTVPKQKVLLKEQYEESREELLQCCCNLAWMKSVWRIPLNVSVLCEMLPLVGWENSL